jgi:hypothetical protein
VLLAWKNNGATAPERARSTGSALGAWIVAARCKAWPTDARRIRSAIINRAINPDLEIGKNKRRSRMSRRKAEPTAGAKPQRKPFELKRREDKLTPEEKRAVADFYSASRVMEIQYLQIARDYGCKR